MVTTAFYFTFLLILSIFKLGQSLNSHFLGHRLNLFLLFILDTTQLNVCLDIILPRIVALCTTSTSSSSSNNTTNANSSNKGTTVDAQCISAAAETLHAIILYMVRISIILLLLLLLSSVCAEFNTYHFRFSRSSLQMLSIYYLFCLLQVGTASSVSTGRATSTLNTSTYEHLLPVVIQLAVSTELACSALFKDLLFQLIRWFSGHNQVCRIFYLLNHIIFWTCVKFTQDLQNCIRYFISFCDY